jgi:hypothetical protein
MSAGDISVRSNDLQLPGYLTLAGKSLCGFVLNRLAQTGWSVK